MYTNFKKFTALCVYLFAVLIMLFVNCRVLQLEKNQIKIKEINKKLLNKSLDGSEIVRCKLELRQLAVEEAFLKRYVSQTYKDLLFLRGTVS